MYKKKKKTEKGRKAKMRRAGTVKSRRTGNAHRVTTETDILIKLNLDGAGLYSVKTGIPFLDHMLSLFSRHGYFDLTITARGDLNVDIHHTNEDIALCLGEAFAQAVGDKKGVQRFGFFYVPMEDALVRVVLDLSNRPALIIDGWPDECGDQKEYQYGDCEHFLKSFSQAAGLNIHVSVINGRDRHHVIEALFKALARALDMATRRDERSKSVPSTKGVL